MPATLSLRNAATLALGAVLSACTDLGLQTINLPSRMLSELQVNRDLVYGESPHQKLDLYVPADVEASRRQLVIFVYGGGWISGARQDYYFVADTLTAAGYAVAIPDYIKYPDGVFPAFVTDVAQSISWLGSNIEQYTEVDEFILMGHSAGAHTAALLLTDPSYLQNAGFDGRPITAFVGLAGPYTFKPEKQKYRDIFNHLEDYNQMRPQHFVSGAEPPMLLLHGEEDTTVLPPNTRKFAAKVEARGGRAETRFYPGAGHVAPLLALARRPFGDRQIRSDILEFLDRQQPVPGNTNQVAY